MRHDFEVIIHIKIIETHEICAELLQQQENEDSNLSWTSRKNTNIIIDAQIGHQRGKF